MNALHKANFPVARTFILCEDSSVIGTPFYVMEFVRGRIFRDLKLPGFSPNDRRAIYDELNRVLTQLHSISISSIGLSDFGKPGNYYERQVTKKFPRNFSPPRWVYGLDSTQIQRQVKFPPWKN
jgi:aminoglycoside phosphotransferase (APT) family kinase protein